jgi:hypothetical protein
MTEMRRGETMQWRIVGMTVALMAGMLGGACGSVGAAPDGLEEISDAGEDDAESLLDDASHGAADSSIEVISDGDVSDSAGADDGSPPDAVSSPDARQSHRYVCTCFISVDPPAYCESKDCSGLASFCSSQCPLGVTVSRCEPC